ncbi:MAG: esterase-like activity of phytase family protein [Hyphomonadaceae bacterium]
MRVLLLALALGACSACADPPPAEQWRPIQTSALPVDLDRDRPGAHRIGQLIFRGGIELQSPDPAFGGYSGLWVDRDGRIVAVSDAGSWLQARLEIDPETAAPLRLADARIALMRDENGWIFTDRASADAEGLARLADGRFAVSFEHSNVVRFYELEREGPMARAAMGPPLAGVEALERNATLEALAQLPDGRLLVGAERGAGRESPIWVRPLNAQTSAPPQSAIELPFGYGFVGADRLPGGDIVAVARFYAPVVGVRIRIVRIAAASLETPHARAETLAELGAGLNLDNFESVAAVPLARGGARLYLIADDNFSPTQRTLLYVFDLPPSP